MDAHLALRRGDTTRALMRIDQQVRNADELEFSGNPGAVRAFAWGDLLTRLGLPREAVEVYGQLDTVRTRVEHPTLHVRSWAERGALYQQLGVPDSALMMYEAFVEAWSGGDPVVQPAVRRAQDAIDALHGQVDEPQETP